MRFIIGGAYQGKTDYVIKKYNISPEKIIDENSFDINKISEYLCINHFHLILKNNSDINFICEKIIKENPDIIIICDEIGNGIIPIEKSERSWRERVGRAGCILAENAESVERIICGVCVRIK